MKRNKQGVTPLFAAEGHIGRLPRPDQPTIDAVTRLMLARGSFADRRRKAGGRKIFHYEKPAELSDEAGQRPET